MKLTFREKRSEIYNPNRQRCSLYRDMVGDIHVPSTIYKLSMIPKSQLDHITTEPIMKLICIKEYNENTEVINKLDVQISFLKCAEKAIEWY